MDLPRRLNMGLVCGLVVAVAVVLSWACVLYEAQMTAQRLLSSDLFAQDCHRQCRLCTTIWTLASRSIVRRDPVNTLHSVVWKPYDQLDK